MKISILLFIFSICLGACSNYNRIKLVDNKYQKNRTQEISEAPSKEKLSDGIIVHDNTHQATEVLITSENQILEHLKSRQEEVLISKNIDLNTVFQSTNKSNKNFKDINTNTESNEVDPLAKTSLLLVISGIAISLISFSNTFIFGMILIIIGTILGFRSLKKNQTAPGISYSKSEKIAIFAVTLGIICIILGGVGIYFMAVSL